MTATKQRQSYIAADCAAGPVFHLGGKRIAGWQFCLLVSAELAVVMAPHSSNRQKRKDRRNKGHIAGMIPFHVIIEDEDRDEAQIACEIDQQPLWFILIPEPS
mgnify:CR=1 FL=1